MREKLGWTRGTSGLDRLEIDGIMLQSTAKNKAETCMSMGGAIISVSLNKAGKRGHPYSKVHFQFGGITG